MHRVWLVCDVLLFEHLNTYSMTDNKQRKNPFHERAHDTLKELSFLLERDKLPPDYRHLIGLVEYLDLNVEFAISYEKGYIDEKGNEIK